MKKVLFIVTAMIILAMISSCATSKRFITIKEPDIIYERGEEKFEVIPNDTLEIIETKTCRDGTGICCSGQVFPDSNLSFSSATAGDIPLFA